MNLITHSRCVNVVVEPVTGYSDHIATARSYGVLKPGRGKIDVCLRNHGAKKITLPKCTAVGEITAANIISALLALNPTGYESGKGKATTGKRKYESQKELLDKNGLCRSWFSLEQNCRFIEDKLSSATVDFIRSEGIAERQHLIWGMASSLSMPRT